MLTNYVGDGRLMKFGVRFTNQVWPGDDLDAKATVVEIREEAAGSVTVLGRGLGGLRSPAGPLDAGNSRRDHAFRGWSTQPVLLSCRLMF